MMMIYHVYLLLYLFFNINWHVDSCDIKIYMIEGEYRNNGSFTHIIAKYIH